MNLKVGDKVFIKHPSGFISPHTPQWCISWTGTIVRLNRQTVTVEFEVNESKHKTIQRYIDYQDIQLLEE